MEKDINRIWIVETSQKYGEFGEKLKSVSHSYFSSEEKAKLHIEWLAMCAVNNGAFLYNSDEKSSTYKLQNGEFWSISLNKDIIDADDILMGEA